MAALNRIRYSTASESPAANRADRFSARIGHYGKQDVETDEFNSSEIVNDSDRTFRWVRSAWLRVKFIEGLLERMIVVRPQHPNKGGSCTADKPRVSLTMGERERGKCLKLSAGFAEASMPKVASS